MSEPTDAPSQDRHLIAKPCPTCKKNSVIIVNDAISCSADPCKFSVRFACPICDQSLSTAKTTRDSHDTYLHCGQCNNAIGLKKIKYLIDSGMHVDSDNRCTLCNGPTIHRASMNLGHRCFFFPKCSGQTDLFGATRESFTFLDFETTGLEAGRDYIIEIGAIKIDEEGYEHVFQELIKPPAAISAKITQITGITDEMVANAPLLTPTLDRLLEFIGSSKLVIHNADFDMIWLLTGLKRMNRALHSPAVICTLKWARAMGEPAASLGALTRKYGIGHSNAHRALADAAATKELFFIFERAAKIGRPTAQVDDYNAQATKAIERYADYVQP